MNIASYLNDLHQLNDMVSCFIDISKTCRRAANYPITEITWAITTHYILYRICWRKDSVIAREVLRVLRHILV